MKKPPHSEPAILILPSFTSNFALPIVLLANYQLAE